jgi:iron transport multicopper oxidase
MNQGKLSPEVHRIHSTDPLHHTGLAVTMVSFPNETQNLLTIPQKMIDQCNAQGIAPTGNIVGKMSTTDFKGEPYGPWPQVLGWRPKGKPVSSRAYGVILNSFDTGIGALAGCIITVLLGFATVVWYSHGNLDEAEIEEEIQRKHELQVAKGGKYGFVKKLVKGSSGASGQ